MPWACTGLTPDARHLSSSAWRLRLKKLFIFRDPKLALCFQRSHLTNVFTVGSQPIYGPQAIMSEMEFTPEMIGEPTHENPLGHGANVTFISDSERLCYKPHLSEVRKAMESGVVPRGFELAGPRARILFEP